MMVLFTLSLLTACEGNSASDSNTDPEPSPCLAECELDRNSVVVNFASTAANGKTYQFDYYNLDVIISVGYR